MEVTNFDGFICNRESHWFAIRKINGNFWNLNSTKERPELISHFRLAAEIELLQRSGYSVFCVVEIGGLPQPCTANSEAEIHSRGLPQFWWREGDLMSGQGNKGFVDVWSNVGTGMRLDGKSRSTSSGSGNSNSNNSNNPSSIANIEGLTEEEMLQMAMAASMQELDKDIVPTSKETYDIQPEPSVDAPGSMRIQFRLPTGKRQERRFDKNEKVGVLFTFVRDCCPSEGKTLELRAGFPPKDLSTIMGDTLETSKLSGEAVQCRYC